MKRPLGSYFSRRAACALTTGLWFVGFPVFAADPAPPPAPSPAETTLPAEAERVIPISLDTVFRMAEGQNAQVSRARAQVDQALAEQDLAAKKWIPDLYAGVGYYRHEGGIQQEDGTLIRSSMGAVAAGTVLHGKLDLREAMFQKVDAERKMWQQKAELSRITSEQLLDAASTYIDLLAARSGEAIAVRLEKEVDDLVQRTQKLAEVERGAKVELERVRGELNARRASVRKARTQAEAASAKLGYLLGLEPCVRLQPADTNLMPIELVDVSRPVNDLVAQAMSSGPGVHELESLLSLIDNAIAKSKGPARLIPTVQLWAGEGDFGAGPGANISNSNRLDIGVAVGWNLTNLVTRCERQRVADAQRQQAHFAYADLRGRLALGVQEARETILGERDDIGLSQDQISHAEAANKLSKQRLEESIQGSSPSEVLMSLQGLGLAQWNYLNAVREYNKAQIRMLLLTGVPPSGAAPCAQP